MDLPRMGDGAKRTWSDDAIGSKAANLARMAALGLPVPPAFVLPVGLCADIIAGQAHAEQALREGLS